MQIHDTNLGSTHTTSYFMTSTLFLFLFFKSYDEILNCRTIFFFFFYYFVLLSQNLHLIGYHSVTDVNVSMSFIICTIIIISTHF